MKVRGSLYFVILIMIGMLILMGLALRMQYFTSRLLPLMFGGAIFLLGAIQLVSEILPRVRSETTVTEEQPGEEKKSSWYGYLLIEGWVVGFLLAIYLLGFMIAIPLFTVSYMKSHGTRWLVAIAFGLVVSVLIYGIFEIVLQVKLYQGLLSAWLSS